MILWVNVRLLSYICGFVKYTYREAFLPLINTENYKIHFEEKMRNKILAVYTTLWKHKRAQTRTTCKQRKSVEDSWRLRAQTGESETQATDFPPHTHTHSVRQNINFNHALHSRGMSGRPDTAPTRARSHTQYMIHNVYVAHSTL